MSICCLRLKTCRALNFLYSSRTVLLLIEPEKLSICMLSRETPKFISPTLWPPISLISIHCTTILWRVLQTRTHDVHHLKQRIMEERNRFDQKIFDNAINE